MALSRMIKLGELCPTKTLFNQRLLLQPAKHVRRFKRVRQDEKNVFESIAPPFANVNLSTHRVNATTLLKPLGFTVGFSALCFGGAVIWQYENMRAHAISMLHRPMDFMQKRIDNKFGSLRKEMNTWWNKLSPGEKVFAPICFINVLIFFAWRIPRLQPTMLKYFCSNPSSSSICWPMLLSTFSHYSLFHLLANMYVLHSFSTGAVASLGKEQFLGLYLSAGVISSFTSYVYKAVTKQPGLSLGASGAIMAILGYVCTQYPDTKLGIILLPFLTFSAGSAIKAIIALDTAGVLLGWKIFDHAAHLGGAACGVAWAYWGHEHMWLKRDPILQYWHEIRGAIK
ncbi:presenilin-associated rhomboid-like protein, mitochondrial [Onthophagus taurus]|uniref:presenilin-associated rhomboid-like protein, mitochondrial n=1 Tax=Onthophagus taurus TaxID=166361 RepID=UPI0039BE4AB0